MQMPVIIDIILAVVLIVFTVFGWRRGAFKSIIGIVIVIAALLGAGFVAEQGAPVAARAITPMIAERVEARIDAQMEQYLPSPDVEEEAASSLFSGMGLYRKTAENMAGSVAEQVRETGQSLVEAAVESMVLSVARAVLFLLTFLGLLVILKIAAGVLGLLTAVPGLHLMNAACGGLFGLLQGCLALFAVIWAIQFFGNGIPEEVVAQTILFRFFTTLNPLAMVFSL